MSTESLAQPARTPILLEVLAELIETELHRLRMARPHLSDRLDRASHILVCHLSSSARTRPIRCRIRSGGRPVLLVRSLSAGGVTYEVSPRDWSCSCPDYHRRGAACKHVLGAWILWRASLPREATCADCKETFPPDRLIEVGEGQAEETLNSGERVCRMCAPRHGLPAKPPRYGAGAAR